jgi:hypothetical protein
MLPVYVTSSGHKAVAAMLVFVSMEIGSCVMARGQIKTQATSWRRYHSIAR